MADMSLTSALESQFDRGVRLRGSNYFFAGRVKVNDKDENHVSAVVRGSTRYHVNLDYEHGTLTADCTCPYFEGGRACKHIWATVLAADGSGFAPQTKNASRIHLKTGDRSDDGQDDLEACNENGEYGDDDKNDALGRVRHLSSQGWKPVFTPNFTPQRKTTSPPKPSWKSLLARHINPGYVAQVEQWPSNKEIIYQLDMDELLIGGAFTLRIACRQIKQNGDWSKPKPLKLTHGEADALPLPADRKIIALLAGSEKYYSYTGAVLAERYTLSNSLRDVLLPMLCETGRFWLGKMSSQTMSLLRYDDGAPWEFRIELVRDEKRKEYIVSGVLVRGEEKKEVSSPELILQGGWGFWPGVVARLNDAKAFDWIMTLRQEREIRVAFDEGGELAEALYGGAVMPPVIMPDELRYEEVSMPPQPHLTIRRPKYARDSSWLWAQLRFNYKDSAVDPQRPGGFVLLKDRRIAIRRDLAVEQDANQKLMDLGMRRLRNPWETEAQWEFAGQRLNRIVPGLIADNWMVEAEGKLYRRPGDLKIDVTTGVDWFELRGIVDFDGVSARLPALLKALKHQENTIVLSDGTIGMLPDEWLKKYGTLAALGSIEGDHVEFQRNQAGLLDALLASQPDATCDDTFRAVREQLRGFEAIKPANPSGLFKGTLRPYQCEGLGWLEFLQTFKFGGCLADDMGLGKTVQVLALLESRRVLREERKKDGSSMSIGPSLAVVPRTLIFNWKQEAARFTPSLRIMDHTGTGRQRGMPDFGNYDLVLTTYGTLLRDIAHLKDVLFDYIILDEAQAIKNANAQTAKATRLLKCEHRLALSGTPVQNHLGELWSLFEFLNPGMLGTASVFRLTDAGGRSSEPETRELLSRALRPFILRRTKSQVAKDLPERTDETLYCELDGAQRKLYDELREHYRRSLLKKVDEEGMAKSKIMILEALLRLRQAACHPGLIDKTRVGESSAKLEALMPQMSEIMEEGHKALVFSQFTSMLAIVRRRLDKEGVVYEYLDGKTRDREEPVRRFQEDPACKLFLISLKAGGLGLNLTAAEYVFLLDPWWNPAVEMQAIDRAHRIGQTRQVFAYRLIAKDTVEEKVLELQKFKKDLADSIINADNSIIRDLRREDLELLLG